MFYIVVMNRGLANLAQMRALKEKIDDLHTQNFYLVAYSGRENIKFMKVKETARRDQREGTEQVLRDFLEKELGFLNARDVEMQRVSGKAEMRNRDQFSLAFCAIKTARRSWPWVAAYMELDMKCSGTSQTK